MLLFVIAIYCKYSFLDLQASYKKRLPLGNGCEKEGLRRGGEHGAPRVHQEGAPAPALLTGAVLGQAQLFPAGPGKSFLCSLFIGHRKRAGIHLGDVVERGFAAP